MIWILFDHLWFCVSFFWFSPLLFHYIYFIWSDLDQFFHFILCPNIRNFEQGLVQPLCRNVLILCNRIGFYMMLFHVYWPHNIPFSFISIRLDSFLIFNFIRVYFTLFHLIWSRKVSFYLILCIWEAFRFIISHFIWFHLMWCRLMLCVTFFSFYMMWSNFHSFVFFFIFLSSHFIFVVLDHM